eukprot:3205436-Rhodomonas_salina.2
MGSQYRTIPQHSTCRILRRAFVGRYLSPPCWAALCRGVCPTSLAGSTICEVSNGNGVAGA